MKTRFSLLVLLIIAGSVLVTPSLRLGASYAPFSDTEVIGATAIAQFTPACEPQQVVPADIYIMLDRTGSMEAVDLTNERTAAKALLTALDGLTTQPYVGIGVFGDNGTSVAANPDGTLDAVNLRSLTNAYGDNDLVNDNDLYDGIDDATAGNSSVGTDLDDALDVARDFVTAVVPGSSNNDIIILLTDAERNGPTFEQVLDMADDVKNSVERIIIIHFSAGGDLGGTGDLDGYQLAGMMATGSYAYSEPAGHDGSPHTHTGSIANANENTDGDDLYIAPSSADLEALFLAIALDICVEPTPTVGHGAISIVADVVGGTNAQLFTFTAPTLTSGTMVCTFDVTPTAFTLSDDATPTTAPGPNQTCSNVPEGSYVITDTTVLPAGWTRTNITCTDGSGGTSSVLGTGVSTIDLDAGEHVTCIYTYTAPPTTGSITIIKDLAGGGTNAQVFSFDSDITSGCTVDTNPSNGFNLADDGAGGTADTETCATASAGVHWFSEDGEAGWSLTNIVCTGATTSVIDIETAIDASPDAASNVFNAGDDTVNINLVAGESIICTFTNTQLTTGSITIIKDSVPNDGQNFSFSSDLNSGGCTPDADPSPFELDDDSNGDFPNTETCATVPIGIHWFNETSVTGWVLTNIVCTGATASVVDIQVGIDGSPESSTFAAGDDTVNVNLVGGENIVCTFTNTKNGSITIVKDVVGGTNAQVFTFDSDITSGCTPDTNPSDNFSLADDGAGGTTDTETCSVVPGQYWFMEPTRPASWLLTNIVCTGQTSSVIDIATDSDDSPEADAFAAGDDTVSINLAAGENITCTFSNEAFADLNISPLTSTNEPSGQDLNANATGAAGFSARAAWTLSNNGALGITTVTFTGAFNANSLTLTGGAPVTNITGSAASVVTAWGACTISLTAWSCDGPLAPGESITLEFWMNGADQEEPGEPDDGSHIVTFTPNAPSCAGTNGSLTNGCVTSLQSDQNFDASDLTADADSDTITNLN